MVTAHKRLNRITPFQVINAILLVLLSVVMLYPLLYIFAIAFNDSADTLKGGIWLFPRKFTFDNIAVAFQDDRIFNSLVVSVLRVVVTTVLAVILTVMLAYGVLDKKLVGRKFFLKYIFFSTLFSGGIIPFFLLMRDLNLVNRFWIYVLPAQKKEPLPKPAPAVSPSWLQRYIRCPFLHGKYVHPPAALSFLL